MVVPSNALQSSETGTSHYWERSDGIIVQCLKPGVTQSLADARENLVVFERLARDRKRPVLVDMRVKFSTAPGVREFYATPEAGRLVSCMALLIQSSFGRIVGNLYMTVTPPKFPMRMFNAEDEAIAWLQRMGGRAAGAPK